ncbi:hypothetical protein [Marinobacter piscensis]|uniref:hypothetical protein n=1 Tax=Marinobacter piscensis TaxID=1562308 RepID=UPI00119E9A9A|nr:hypothetical protein [Marinobacter piscensis]
MLWKFDPVIRESGHYRRSLSVINGLLCFVFVIAGVVAFYFDNMTLPGRLELAEFSGKWAHGVGVACFFIAAYWVYQSVKEYRVSLLTFLVPFITAALVSATLLAIKYG